MGRQINFYLSNGDQEELARRLDATGCVYAAGPPFESAEIPVQSVSRFARWESGQQDPMLFQYPDARDVVLRRPNPELGYFVDIVRSSAVEFSRCMTTNERISRGRLYYIVGFVDDDFSKFEKPSEFVKWAADLFKIVRKICIEKRKGDYIGREALAMEKHGYRLVRPALCVQSSCE